MSQKVLRKAESPPGYPGRAFAIHAENLLDDLDHFAGLWLNDHATIVNHRKAVVGVIGNRPQHDGPGKRLADYYLFLHAYGRHGLAGHIRTNLSRRLSRRTDRRTDRAAYDGAHRTADNRASRSATHSTSACGRLCKGESRSHHGDRYY
jgi:hypothetical protein